MDFGTDINSNWELTEQGDLRLISDEENLAQAIINRLSCKLNSLDLYYNEYGSLLYGFLGWKRKEKTLEFIRIELGNRLNSDSRIKTYSIDLEYNEDGDISINLLVNGNVEVDMIMDTQLGTITEA